MLFFYRYIYLYIELLTMSKNVVNYGPWSPISPSATANELSHFSPWPVYWQVRANPGPNFTVSVFVLFIVGFSERRGVEEKQHERQHRKCRKWGKFSDFYQESLFSEVVVAIFTYQIQYGGKVTTGTGSKILHGTVCCMSRLTLDGYGMNVYNLFTYHQSKLSL